MSKHVNKQSVLVIAVMILGLALVNGCSSAPTYDDTFWKGLQTEALEYDPPSNLSDLVDRAEIIVTGKVLALETGPVDKSDEGTVTVRTTALVAQVDDVLKGSVRAKEIRIVMVQSGPLDSRTKPTGSQAMFFLVPRPDGYYACARLAGIVEDTPLGLMTVVDPTQSVLVSGGSGEQNSFEDLTAEVRALV